MASIVVIGGGLLGTSVAYHLARRGKGSVLLLERLGLSTAASSQAAGLMFMVSSKPAVDRLSRVTFKDIDSLEEQLNDHLDFHRVGTVRFAEKDQSRTKLETLYNRAQQEGISAEIVNKEWLAKKLPWLTLDSDALSIFFLMRGTLIHIDWQPHMLEPRNSLGFILKPESLLNPFVMTAKG